VGSSVGCLVGLLDGDGVGCLVGSSVGSRDGELLGVAVVGNGVGDDVGFFEG